MRTDGLANYEIVTVAVAILDGDKVYVHPEDIAVKANQITPSRFNWRKAPEQIDLDAVRVALRDAKKIKNGELLIGSNVEGWMLSQNGLIWTQTFDVPISLKEHEEEIEHRKNSILAEQEMERARLRNTRAFKLFIDGDQGSMTLEDFYQFARVNEYFQAKARHRRYAILDIAVVGTEDLADAWQFLKTKFPKEIV